MRRVILLLALIIAGAAPARPILAQQNVVVVADSVRAKLARDWDRQAKNPYQLERAYCVTFDTFKFAGGTAYLITSATTPERTGPASSDTIVFYCEDGPGRAALHIHPPTTCESATKCRFGGVEAYECFASDLDERTLTRSSDVFGLIQCDRHAVVAFWPGKRTSP